jgi:hypothetical protein
VWGLRLALTSTLHACHGPQGFEQLAFELWELYKIAGNRPGSHHLVIPRIRDL